MISKYHLVKINLHSVRNTFIIIFFIQVKHIFIGVRKIAPRKIGPQSGSGFGLELALELGLQGNSPGGQFS